MASLLEDRAVIALSGSDTRSFLQGLITNDIAMLSAGNPLYAALLTPQGKILFDFVLSEDAAGAVLIDCAASLRDTLVKRLTMYRLRAKIEITARSDLAVFASWEGDSPPHSVADPRLAALGQRAIAPRQGMPDNTYLDHRLRLGVPEGVDFGQDKVFALDAGLEELHGVSFEKGCYVGQELTARMKHKGTARKRLLPIGATDNALLPAPGTAVAAGNVNIGEITSTYGTRGFALIRLDRAEKNGVADITAAGVAVNVTKPKWLFP
jgi:hypothetical protein